MILKRRASTPLEKALGHRFRRPELLDLALVHRSHANEESLDGHNERVEFLGDAVLGIVAAEWLYRRFPERAEGDLSRLKSSLVSSRALSRYAEKLGVAEALKLGVGEERSGGRSKPSLLADATEALFGAIFLDAGFEAARKTIVGLFEESLNEPVSGVGDAKTRLQEVVQARGWDLPEYRVVATSGPDHEKRFTVECVLQEQTAARGEGRSKKVAEQQAAAQVLDTLSASTTDD